MSVDSYVKRSGSGDVKIAWNDHLANVMVCTVSSDVMKPIFVEADATTALKPYHYMWDQLPSRANAFRSRVNRLTNAILNKHESELGAEAPGIFHLPSTQEVLCVGKLCGEQDKLDEQHMLFLEGVSPENDTVHRIKVDLLRLKSWSLFSGQVVAMRAVNPTGASLQATDLWTDASLSPASTDSTKVYEEGPVKVTVATGPFCTHSNLDYRPLDDLLDAVDKSNPDVLVLMGPFVDSQHPVVAEGSLPQTYEDLWNQLVERIMDRVIAHNRSVAVGKTIQKVVLVPSLQDMHHPSVFPQFPLVVPELLLKKPAMRENRDLLMSMPNPCLLRINGVLFGFTTADPLRHMCSALYSRRDTAQPHSLVLEAAERLIEQQSFMPISPLPSHTEDSVGINLDSTQLQGTEFGEETPQILVVPSVLKEFVDTVKGSIVVNPQTLVRFGKGAGTFTEITLYPAADDDGQPGDMDIDNKAFDVMKRVGVRIVKI